MEVHLSAVFADVQCVTKFDRLRGIFLPHFHTFVLYVILTVVI